MIIGKLLNGKTYFPNDFLVPRVKFNNFRTKSNKSHEAKSKYRNTLTQNQTNIISSFDNLQKTIVFFSRSNEVKPSTRQVMQGQNGRKVFLTLHTVLSLYVIMFCLSHNKKYNLRCTNPVFDFLCGIKCIKMQ